VAGPRWVPDVTARFRTRLRVLLRRGRTPGLRTAKTVLAAVLAFQIATWLHTSSSPILAPLTALLVVQLTMYETFAHGLERIVSVVAGVLVALLFARVMGLTWWSLGLVVAASLIAGRLLRLGPNLLEVPISAMLVLGVGGASSAAVGRIDETLVGAAVGVLVNLLVVPPLYIQPASDAIAELAERLAGYCRGLAAALRGEWSREVAEDQLDRARALGAEVARADERLARTEQSARLNPRGRVAREAQPRLRGTLTALEHAQVGLRNLARTLLDRTFFVPPEEAEQAWPPEARAALADVLDAVAGLLAHAAQSCCAPRSAPAADQEGLLALAALRNRLAAALVVDAKADPAAWAQYGALLDAVDRLRVELATAQQPPEIPWAPPPLAEPQRRAVRQALDRRRRQ
jgi:uncharacterized membrane protein YgaE (UPF0421/DUF939 family)